MTKSSTPESGGSYLRDAKSGALTPAPSETVIPTPDAAEPPAQKKDPAK